MIPFGDDNPTEHLPILTLLLIFINVFIFFLLWFQPNYAAIVKQYGFIPAKYNFFNIITSMFLHGGLIHLVFNMWFLWLFGDNLEDKLGKFLFLSFYLIGGVFASFMHYFVSTPAIREIPCIGASGAISAIMGGYLVLFPRARIKVFGFILFYPVRFKLSAFLFLGVWFVSQLFSGGAITRGVEVTEVAYWAHIGGFLFGVIFSLFLKEYVFPRGHFITQKEKEFKKYQKKTKFVADVIFQEAKIKKEKSNDFKKIIKQYLDEGRSDLAVKEYINSQNQFLLVTLEAKNQKLIADILFEQNKKQFALQAYLKFVTNYPDHKQISDVKCRLGLLLIKDFQSFSDGVMYLKDGLKHWKLIGNQNLLSESKKELERIDEMFSKMLIGIKKEASSESRFTILAQIINQGTSDARKIFDLLYSIGIVDGRNIGVKLAYNAEYNLKTKYGVILQNIDVVEMDLAVNKLRSKGIFVIPLLKEKLLNFSGINRVTETLTKGKKLIFKIESGKNFELDLSNILHVALGQLPYYIYRKSRNDESSLFKVEGMRKENGVQIDDLGTNRVVDIFTKNSLRFRISNLGLICNNKGSIDVGNNELFSLFIKDLILVLGGNVMNKKSRVLFLDNDWKALNFKSDREFSEKALWAVCLKKAYSQLLGDNDKVI